MTYPTIWDFALLVTILGIFGIRYLLQAYFAEKGKNLASKEDLEELTCKVEGVKTQYSSELERLRFELGRASFVHQAQYETEVRVYEEIWKCLVDVQTTVLALRPMLDHFDPNESDEQRRKRRSEAVTAPYNAMEAAIWKNKPFYNL